jgi:hypothetical protein
VPLGYRKDGRAIWPIMGASEDPAPTPPAPSDPAPPEPTPPADPPADPPKDPADDGKGGKEAILADLAKERDKRQKAEQAQQATLDGIAKALGLKPEDTPPDAAKLTEQVTAEQTRANAAERKLAVFLAAGDHDANAKALLDSTSFLESIKDIEHTDTAKLGAAIKAAVANNPVFKTTTTPPFPGGPRKPAGAPDPGPGLPRLRDAYAQTSK